MTTLKFGKCDNISETVQEQDRDMVAMEIWQEIVCGLSNGTIAICPWKSLLLFCLKPFYSHTSWNISRIYYCSASRSPSAVAELLVSVIFNLFDKFVGTLINVQKFLRSQSSILSVKLAKWLGP